MTGFLRVENTRLNDCRIVWWLCRGIRFVVGLTSRAYHNLS